MSIRAVTVIARLLHWFVLSASAAAALSIAGCSPQHAVQLSEQDNRTASSTVRRDTRSSLYVIQYGDQVQVSVFGYPEFNAAAVVKESGMITVPLIGEFRAAGLTREQLTDRLAVKLTEYVRGKAVPTVTITGAMATRVVILGSVGSQGSYQLSAPTTLFQALALAGGPAKDADLSHVKLLRKGDPGNAQELDIAPYMGTDGYTRLEVQDDLPLVNPGDMVLVPREENIIREFGDLVRDVALLFSLFALIR